MDGGDCSHPASSLYFIREQGITICTLCNDVVPHQVYELDPQFSRRGGGGGGSGGGGSTYRPLRATVSGPSTHARPSMEVARRHMLNIARAVEMTDEHVEMALGIYKLAVNMNVVSGIRDTVLCACLYAVCRREHLPHVIYDFSSECQVRPQAILSQMRFICQETHTEVPVVDPACLVQRFADYLDLGSATPHVLICALKLLRVMREDWIACGRRPMGVCAAALVAACCLLGVPRTADQICGVVRLTAGTIMRRLNEFSSTPAAQLTSIDAYKPTNTTLPPAFTEASQRSIEEDANAEDRLMRSLYFQLVGEAKVSAPATPERCQRWRFFVKEHCRLQNILVTEEDLDLRELSPEKQLTILGLPHTKPIPPAVVEESVRKEEARLLLLKQEEILDGTEGGGLGMKPLSTSRTTADFFPELFSTMESSVSEDSADSKKWWQNEGRGGINGSRYTMLSTNGEGETRDAGASSRGFSSVAQEEEWVGQVWNSMSSSHPNSSSMASGGNTGNIKTGKRDSPSSSLLPPTLPLPSHSPNDFAFLDANDPSQISALVAQFEKAKGLDEVRHLEDDFDFCFNPTPSSSPVPPSCFTLANGASTTTPNTADSFYDPSTSSKSSTMFLSGGGVVSSCGGAANGEEMGTSFRSSPFSGTSTIAYPNASGGSTLSSFGSSERPSGDVEMNSSLDHRRVLAEMLWDKERRHALPWEFILLPEAEVEDTSDILSYIILDNEERLRRHKIGEVMYKEKWERGRAKADAGRDLDGFSSSSRRRSARTRHKRHLIHRPAGVHAVDRALRGCGAGNIRTSHLSEIIPELGGAEEEAVASPDEWWE